MEGTLPYGSWSLHVALGAHSDKHFVHQHNAAITLSWYALIRMILGEPVAGKFLEYQKPPPSAWAGGGHRRSQLAEKLLLLQLCKAGLKNRRWLQHKSIERGLHRGYYVTSPARLASKHLAAMEAAFVSFQKITAKACTASSGAVRVNSGEQTRAEDQLIFSIQTDPATENAGFSMLGVSVTSRNSELNTATLPSTS